MTVDFTVITQTVLTLLVVIMIGFLSENVGFAGPVFSKKLATFTMCVAQPCMLFISLVKVAYSPQNLRTGLWILLLALCVHIVMAVVAFGATRFFRDPDEKKITEFSLLFVNCAFVGYPILKAVFGEIGLFWGAFYVTAFNLIIWTYGMSILGRGRNDIKMNLKKVFLNYGTVPCLLGLIVYALHPSIPAVLVNGLSYVGDLCTPLALIVIGANLARVPLKNLLSDGKVYYFAVIRLLVLPLLIVVLCRLVGLSDTMCLFSGVMASLPTAANTVMFAEMYDIRPDLAAKNVGMAAVLSMGSIPVVILLSTLILNI